MLSGSSADCSLPLNVSLFQLLVQDYKRDKLLQLLDLKVRIGFKLGLASVQQQLGAD